MSKDTGYAVWIDRYGTPEVLIYGKVDLPDLGVGEVRIRTIAAAINHTDLEIRAGNWPIRRTSPFPYVPGVEVVGRVDALGDDVSDVEIGDTVITMMQGLGGVRAERPGGYATHVTVDASSVARLPTDIDPLQAAAIGLSGVTALGGLRRFGDIGQRRVLVSGAAGGVGSAAVSIAKAMGASVLAVVNRAEQVDFVEKLGADSVIVASPDGSAAIARSSVDCVFDTVGAELFPTYVAALKPQGVLSIVGAVSGGEVSFDLWELIRPLTLTGYSSENLTGDTLRRDMDDLAGWLQKGAITLPRWTQFPLAEAGKAHSLLEARGVTGRVLLLP